MSGADPVVFSITSRTRSTGHPVYLVRQDATQERRGTALAAVFESRCAARGTGHQQAKARQGRFAK